MSNKNLFLPLVAAFAMFFAPLASSMQDGGSEGEGETAPPDGGAECTHTGVAPVELKVMDQGGTQCPDSSFNITIGTSHGGGSVSINFNGCPSYITTRPAHDKKVQKLNHNAVNPQKVWWKTQGFTAYCGSWWGASATCTPNGAPTSGPQFATHYEEEGCPIQTSNPN